jgi:bifunctional non-homologous end joining protein LigD
MVRQFFVMPASLNWRAWSPRSRTANITPAALTCGPKAPAVTDTFVVAGWAKKEGKFDGIYLGRQEGRRLVYAGKLERGFTEDDKKRILALFERLKAEKQPIEAPRRFPKAQWLKPRVLVDAEFRGKTGDGLLRHPAFKGVRRDLME